MNNYANTTNNLYQFLLTAYLDTVFDFGRDIALRCPRPRRAGGTNAQCSWGKLRRWTRRGRRSAPSLPRTMARCTLLLTAAFATCLVAVANAAPTRSPAFSRESIEWCDIWIPHANENKLPRVLLIGDSISRDYYPEVEKNALVRGHPEYHSDNVHFNSRGISLEAGQVAATIENHLNP